MYRHVAQRTVLIAALVTLTDALLAFPIAFYMAKVASPRMKGVLVVAILMPLWSFYLVKVYAWQTDALDGRGDQLGPRPARRSAVPGMAPPRSGWWRATSGCRT